MRSLVLYSSSSLIRIRWEAFLTSSGASPCSTHSRSLPSFFANETGAGAGDDPCTNPLGRYVPMKALRIFNSTSISFPALGVTHSFWDFVDSSNFCGSSWQGTPAFPLTLFQRSSIKNRTSSKIPFGCPKTVWCESRHISAEFVHIVLVSHGDTISIISRYITCSRICALAFISDLRFRMWDDGERRPGTCGSSGSPRNEPNPASPITTQCDSASQEQSFKDPRTLLCRNYHRCSLLAHPVLGLIISISAGTSEVETSIVAPSSHCIPHSWRECLNNLLHACSSPSYAVYR